MSTDQNQSPPKPESPGQQSKWNEQEREIAVAAYYIWEKEGRPQGRDSTTGSAPSTISAGLSMPPRPAGLAR